MANYSIENNELTIKLGFWKTLGALSGSFSVPLNCIVGTSVDETITWSNVGLRMGGTGIPGLIALGRFWKPKQWIFCDWSRGQRVAVIELTNFRYSRLVLGLDNPEELVKALSVKARV